MNPFALVFRALALFPVLGLLCVSLSAQTPLLRWSFEGGKGAPTTAGGISGAVLSIENAPSVPVAFQSSGGVGPATPGVFDGTANPYGDADGSVRIRTSAAPILANTDLPRFVVTMWIKPSVPPAQQPYARLLNISVPVDEKSDPGLLVSLHDTNIELGVNGNTAIVPLPPGTIKEGAWTFVAFVYDGTAKNPYYSAEMQNAVQGQRNAAVLTGSLADGVKLSGTFGLNTGAPNYNTSPGTLPIDGLSVAVGSSNSIKTRAFSGLIDDIRIYKGLLTTAQIEEVRASVNAK